jgi:hypothetical protein
LYATQRERERERERERALIVWTDVPAVAVAVALASAGFLSPFLDSDLTTLCRVHGTGARKNSQLWEEAAGENLACVLGLTGVRGGAMGVPGGPASPARDESSPTSRATNPAPVVGGELALKLDCPASPPAATTCNCK